MADLFDLITVGGGLAGAAVARSLAQTGARVLVLEREEQFRDRVRGEMMTPWGVAEAENLQLADLLRNTCAHALPWIDMFAGPQQIAHRNCAATTPQQRDCMAFYHPAMQEALIEAAAKSGAEVRRGVVVKEVRPGKPPAVILENRAGGDGSAEKICARMVVGADGRSSMARKSAGFEVHRDLDRMLLAGALLENVAVRDDTGKIVLNSMLGCVAVIFPQGHGRARAYYGYQKDSRPRLQGQADFHNFIGSCQHTGADPGWYDGVKLAGPIASFEGADTFVNHPYREGIALVGDAAAASDPSWGQGLSKTMRDARVLRDHLLANSDWDTAGHAYAAEHDRYWNALHNVVNWYTELFLATGPEADARRSRALPLIAQDPTRQPDLIFSGPEVPSDEEARRRFFGED